MRRDNMVAFGVGPFPGSAIGRQRYVVVDRPQLELIRENAFPGLVNRPGSSIAKRLVTSLVGL